MRAKDIILTLSLSASLSAMCPLAEAQYYSYSRSSYSSVGYSSSLVKGDAKPEGRIVRGYYNRFGEVVVTARQPSTNAAPASPDTPDAVAAATTYDSGRPAPARTAKRAGKIAADR